MKSRNVVIIALLIFVLGYGLGAVTGPLAVHLMTSSGEEVAPVNDGPTSVTGVDSSGGSADTDAATSVPASGFTIHVDTLPSTQQTALRAVGIEDTLTITSAQVDCAIDQVGEERVEAIKNGAAPTLLEATKLATCL